MKHGFESVDPLIEKWASAYSLHLFKEEAVRYCYISGNQECFQIVIRQPLSGRLIIEGFSIETIEDEELHQSWQVTVDGLSQGLEQALVAVEGWKRRRV